MITFEEFLHDFLLAIKNDTPEEEIVDQKKDETLLLHDLELDYGLFEDIMIHNLVKQLEKKNQKQFIIDISPILPFLPTRIGLIDRFFNRVEKKYYSKFKPLSIRNAAEMIYTKSLAK